MDIKPKEPRQHEITPEAITQWVNEAEAAGRHRIFYDAHKKAPRGFGIRVTKGGAVAWVLNYYAGGSERRATVGRYPALSPTAARTRAAAMRTAVDAGRDPLGERRAARRAVSAARESAKQKAEYSLAALMKAYVQFQKDNGRHDWRKVESAIARHITGPHPKLASRPAEDVTEDAIMPVFDALTSKGKFTEARKLRAALRAAYTAAKKARKAAGMHQFSGFEIQSNPLEDFELERPKESAEKAAKEAEERKWALSEMQLAAYWRRISAPDCERGALLRFHLLTGGQRSEQLARLKASDFDADEKAVTLYDTKGRRAKVHLHVVPLIPEALAALEAMRGSEGPYLFTLSDGEKPVSGHTVWESVVAISDAMAKAREVERGFTPATIRKTVETRLAAKGVSDEVLARLLSHGLGGVQAKHYNAHHYNDEKRDALRKLRRLCDGKTGVGSRRKSVAK